MIGEWGHSKLQCFYSKLVRLKGRKLNVTWAVPGAFLFQIGTIKRVLFLSEDDVDSMFLFQIGTIKRIVWILFNSHNPAFLFQIGTIKSTKENGLD